MASYNILFRRDAEKELRTVPKPFLQKIISQIKDLSLKPRPAGCQLLKGENRYYRIRQNDYRIVYSIDDEAGQVLIIKIGHRREVYK